MKSIPLGRLLAIATAFGVGWLVYMIGVLTEYDGVLSLLFQPIMAVFFSGLTVLLALLVGLVLRLPPLARLWNASAFWAFAVAGASQFFLICGYSLGLTDVGTHPETKQQFVMLHPAVAVGGYFFLVFSIANWPIRRWV